MPLPMKAVPVAIIALCLAAQGCSYQAWYTGFQEEQRRQCYQNSTQGEIQRCLDQVNNTTYEQYRAQREQTLEQSK